ncbi:MAG: insulinase family protein [Bacteroidetes bacterium]|nr:insulinase family protein [Bacteroidota bacterium]
MKPLVYVMLAIALTGGVLNAAPGGDGVFPYPWETHTLENGLRVVMIPMSSGGLMSYYSVVRTGSRDEYEAGKTGFAHFFEHMMFRGTKNYPASVYDRMVTEMGADANAYTTDDLTAYHLSFASQDLETVIKLESDRFQHLDYAEAPFQTESGAVYGEYRKNRTSPWEVLIEALQETAFTKHTYGHTTMGYEADIKAMPTMYAYSKEFFSRYYRPENVVLLLAGDFDAKKTLDMIRKYYGGWQKGYVAPAVPVEPAQTAERKISVSYDGKTLPLLVVAYKGEALDPSNRLMVAGSMLDDLLFGETSEIYKKLVLQEQKVQFISADFDFNRDPGLWAIYAMVKDAKDLPYVQAEIDRTVETFRTTQVDAKKLANVKKRLKYSFLMNLDTPDKVAGRLARLVAITGGIDVVNQLYAAYDAVTAADIQNAVATYLTPARRTIATLKGRD